VFDRHFSIKADPTPVIRAHYATYVHNATRRQRISDHLLFSGLPLGALVACWAFGVRLPVGASVGILTVAGLLSAFFFGVLLQVADWAAGWADANPAANPQVTERADFLRQIAANAGYASLVSIVTCALGVVASVVSHAALTIFSALVLASGIHLVLVLFMVIKRVFSFAENRLNWAQSGAGVVRQLPEKRNHG
jgi:hypothetical protein